MGQFKTIWLSFIIGLLPLAVMAEGEEVPVEATTEEVVDQSSRMIRQTAKVKGYIPLTVVGQEIDAAYIEETLGERHGAIILLHDKGEKFESQGVITPLRHDLPKYGWSTLTLSFHYPFEPKILLSTSEELSEETETTAEVMDEKSPSPDEAKDVKEEADPENVVLPPVSNQDRIQAALAFLQEKGIKRIIFLGHGVGGDTAIELLDTIKTPVSALVLVGATVMPKSEVFNEFNFPILDVYGSSDLAAVPAAIEHRSVAMKRVNNPLYHIRRVEGADHIFSGLHATLTATVSSWLRSIFIEQADN